MLRLVTKGTLLHFNLITTRKSKINTWWSLYYDNDLYRLYIDMYKIIQFSYII